MNSKENKEDLLKDLEPQQYSDLYFESDVPLADVRKNAIRFLVYVSVLILGAMVFMSFVIHFPTEINVPITLKNEGKEEIIRFPYSIYITETFVEVNDTVTVGQPLVSIGSPEITDLINQMEKGKSNLDLQNTYVARNHEDKVNLLKSESDILEKEVSGIQIEIADLEQQRNTDCDALQNLYISNRQIYEDKQQAYQAGAIAKLEFKNAETEKKKTFYALQSKWQEYKTLINAKSSEITVIHSELKRKEEQIKTLRSEYKNDYNSVDTELKHAKNQLIYNFGDYIVENGKLILLSKKPGKVSYLFEGEKELKSGQILLKVRDDLDIYYARGEVTPNAIGKFKETQKAALKINSFPHFEWGTLNGYIETLSKSPNENGNFIVRLKISDYGNLENMVQVGMDGLATILIEEKSFAAHILHKFKGMVNSTIEGTSSQSKNL